MNTKTLLLLGGAALVAIYFLTRSKAKDPRLAARAVGPGLTLDPKGIPIGTRMADGSTWKGTTVVDTSVYKDDGQF